MMSACAAAFNPWATRIERAHTLLRIHECCKSQNIGNVRRLEGIRKTPAYANCRNRAAHLLIEAAYMVLPHPRLQGRPLQAQAGSRAGCAPDPPLGLFEGL